MLQGLTGADEARKSFATGGKLGFWGARLRRFGLNRLNGAATGHEDDGSLWKRACQQKCPVNDTHRRNSRFELKVPRSAARQFRLFSAEGRGCTETVSFLSATDQRLLTDRGSEWELF